MQLVIRVEGETGPMLAVTDRALHVGTSSDADLLVEGEGVAPVHVRVETGFVEAVADCEIGGVPLARGSRRALVPCVIAVGKRTLVVEPSDRSNEPTTRELALGSLGGPGGLWPYAVVVEGSAVGATIVLREERAYRVGRGAASDLVVDDVEASRDHFEILRRGNDVFVRDIGSTGSTWLGRQPLEARRKARWPAHRMVRLGATVIALVVPATAVSPPSAPAVHPAPSPAPAPMAAQIPVAATSTPREAPADIAVSHVPVPMARGLWGLPVVALVALVLAALSLLTYLLVAEN